MSDKDWSFLKEVARTRYPYKYLMQETARILSILYSKDKGLITKELADCMNPTGSWGGGVSTTMIDQLKESGLDRFVLCTPGWEQLELNPEIAGYAEKSSFILGTYDSFHSMHDPKYAGTDDT